MMGFLWIRQADEKAFRCPIARLGIAGLGDFDEH
jgi:hypothetical protein